MSAVEAGPVPQHLQALANANKIRTARAALIHEVEDGKLTLAAALEEPALQTMMILDLLAACPYRTTSQRRGTRNTTSRRRAQRSAEGVIRRAGVCTGYREVGQLTDRQCSLLLSEYASTVASYRP